MYRDKRVVAFTPYGRERTVSVLFSYMLRDRLSGVLDEWMLCMNTDPDQKSDVEYAKRLAADHDWINLYERPGPLTDKSVNLPGEWRARYMEPKQLNTGRFFWYMQDPDAVFIRFDDDVVWSHPDTLRNLVDHKVGDCADNLGVFPIIWNNAVSSHILQQWRHPVIPGKKVGLSALDPVGWGDPRFAIELHGNLLEVLEDGREDSLLTDDLYVIDPPIQFSVSCFAVSGAEYARHKGVIPYHEEEHWLTQHEPGKTKRLNVVAGNAHVSHFSFFTQREWLLKKTDYLERYEALASEVASDARNVERDSSSRKDTSTSPSTAGAATGSSPETP